MTEDLEGFDPQIHRLLPDQKSWVLRETLRWDFKPQEIKDQYNQLLDRVKEANPGFSFQEASDKIEAVEEKYDYRLFGIYYSEDPVRQLVTERRRLSCLQDLNLITEEEKAKLEDVKTDFKIIVDEVVEETGDDPEETARNIDTLLLFGVARDLFEAGDILIEGPIIQGFEETQDPKIPNETVKKFLKEVFGQKVLRKAKIGRIAKEDRYLIYIPENEKDILKGNKLIRRGVVTRSGDSANFLLAEDQETYLEAAMLFEEVDNLKEVRHDYRMRSHTDDADRFHQITFYGFAVENPSDFDYLTDVSLDSEEDKMRAYILSTISHEVAHRYQF